MRTLVIPVLAALILSGCSGDSNDGEDLVLGDGSKVSVGPAAEGKGGLAGVVVDDAIRPVVGAVVRLSGSDRNITTDAKGVFSWTDIEPGTYFIAVTAKGFVHTQTSADVAAGKNAFVKVQLLRDTSPVPYHTTYKHDGFIQAWGGIGQYFVEGIQATGTCDCRMYFQPDGNVTAFIYEAFWKLTSPDPVGLADFYWILEEDDDNGTDEADYCFSPCYALVDGGGYQGSRVMARLDGPDAYPVAQQSIRIMVTVWYIGDPPDGWSVTSQQ